MDNVSSLVIEQDSAKHELMADAATQKAIDKVYNQLYVHVMHGDLQKLFKIGLAWYDTYDLFANKFFNYDNGMAWTWAFFSTLTLAMDWFPAIRFAQPMKPWIRYADM